MLKAITRQASRVDEKIQKLENPVSTAYFFDHLATSEDVSVVVTEQDFLDANKELVGSVSQKELEHYDRVRRTFETIEEGKEKNGVGAAGTSSADVKGKGKGKGKGKMEIEEETDESGRLLNGVGNGAFGVADEGDDEEQYGGPA